MESHRILDITITLPLRNRELLTNLLQELYQPRHPAFHHFLKPADFAQTFGPSENDYEAVKQFAQSHGLTVRGTHPNRTVLDVRGSVAAVEKAFQIHLGVYQHPREAREFFAPDTNPTLALLTPVLSIRGLNDFILPQPCVHKGNKMAISNAPQNGSGVSGAYTSADLRAAYVPGSSLNGAGQAVALFELDGYQASDIALYAQTTGLASVPLQNILVDGFSGMPGGGLETVETTLDIEMAMAMAPGLSDILIYEGTTNSATAIDDILNRMATDDLAAQIGCSYLFDADAGSDQIFQQFAAQGQSFFTASGDYDAYAGQPVEPADDPNITVVGGTFLGTTGPGGSWQGESVWNNGGGQGGGGGSSTIIPIPIWQQGLDMTANGGSSVYRNLPDVSMVAAGVLIVVNGFAVADYDGTSFATPLWAGFAALANQKAATQGLPPLGFLNPSIYSIGRGVNYSGLFHDIVTGNNTSPASPDQFYAVTGYDLCTGLGTPQGEGLIDALLNPVDAFSISPVLGFTAIGPVGGPFSDASQNYLLTNNSSNSLAWSAGASATWVAFSQSNGVLTPFGSNDITTAAIDSKVSNLFLGDFTASLNFTNLQDGVVQSWPCTLISGNGGFETGEFSFWTLTGDDSVNYPVCLDDSFYAGDALPGVSYGQFVHSGRYGAFLGQGQSIASLTQSLSVPEQPYLLSCWLASFADNGSNTPNEFRVEWDGGVLFDQTNLPAFGYTNLQYLVSATNAISALEFDFRNDPAAFALDEVTLTALPPLAFQNIVNLNGVLMFTFASLPGLTYQRQSTANLNLLQWQNTGLPMTATGSTLTLNDQPTNLPQRFYRLLVHP